MKGSNVVVPLLIVLIVLEAAFVPHQSFVAVIDVPLLRMFAPLPVAVLPASRLKLMVSGPAVGAVPPLTSPLEMPPPLPVALFPVIVTLVNVTESVHAPGHPFFDGCM